MSADVEVVVLHYKRPANIGLVLTAFRSQSVPVKLTLIDAHATGFELGADVLAMADNVVSLQENVGSFTRYVPAFGYDLPYTYFHDDDMVPGPRAVEHFVRHANALPDFGVLGQIGRSLNGGVYRPEGVRRGAGFTSVDSVVRGYFVRSQHLHHVLRLKWQMRWTGKLEDDLLAACAMRLYGGLSVLLTPDAGKPEERIDARELPSPHAMCSRPDHYRQRTQFVSRMVDLGWKPLHG